MIREYGFILHSAWRWAHISKTSWIKHHWTQASWIHDRPTVFDHRFNLIKSDRKFGCMHLVRWKRPGKWTECSVAVSLHYRRKKNVNSQYNTHSHSKLCWCEDLLQSKPASFSCILGWPLRLEIVNNSWMHSSFYTMLEDGYKFLRSFWTKQHWTQACSYCSTTIRVCFDWIKIRL